jgi:hypothetical protein
MEQSLSQYYDNQFSMMASDGWKDLMEDFSQLRDELDNIRTATDAQQLFFRQGQLDILDLILNRRKTCEEVYDQLNDTAYLKEETP